VVLSAHVLKTLARPRKFLGVPPEGLILLGMVVVLYVLSALFQVDYLSNPIPWIVLFLGLYGAIVLYCMRDPFALRRSFAKITTPHTKSHLYLKQGERRYAR
jgi:type IV secretory pathway VirB3-like protein